MNRAVFAVAVGLVLVAGGCESRSRGPVREWVEAVYVPALRDMHDPDLAMNWRGSGRAEPDRGALRESCAEALRRQKRWTRALRSAPDADLSEALRRFLAESRSRLERCSAEGALGPPPHRLLDVQSRLHQLGVDLPQS